MKPCLVCGEPSQANRCPEHPLRVTDRRPRDRVTRANRAAWKNLSRRLRKMQPWCSVPGCASTDLTVDHIVPLSEGGEPYDLDNLRVLCRSHNTQRTRGDGVIDERIRLGAKPQGATHLGMILNKGDE